MTTTTTQAPWVNSATANTITTTRHTTAAKPLTATLLRQWLVAVGPVVLGHARPRPW